MHALQTHTIWRFGADMSALFDWDGVSAVFLVLTLAATIHLANRQNRLQTRKEAAAIHALSLLLQRWSTTCSISATIVSAGGHDDVRADLDMIWGEMQRIDPLTLPAGEVVSAALEVRALMEKALHPPSLGGDLLPSQVAHWSDALMDVRDLALYWHEMLARQAKEHIRIWPGVMRRKRRLMLVRPEARLAKAARAMAARFHDAELTLFTGAGAPSASSLAPSQPRAGRIPDRVENH